ncbi:site-specific integrase [Pseudomonas stutzeri]|nr:site-specific integrase [Stutzerimonas stutzeri]
MNEVERYLQAGTRENTRRSYQAAIEHFEVSWGGFLPATSDGILRYLAAYAGQLALATLRQRLAALAQWHVSQGFPDPTKAPAVRQMLKGIRALHPQQARQAAPLQVQHLQQAADWLEHAAQQAAERGELARLRRCRRDLALLLIGFWRGFRSDELCRLRVEDIRAEAGVGMTLYLPFDKGDRERRGTHYRVPALRRLCPVAACLNWIEVAGLSEGPLLRRIDRWGNLAAEELNPAGLSPLLRRILARAGVPAEAYSSHSLRRGFATWATRNGWDLKALMSYVGWRDARSALRYIDPSTSFGGLALDGGEAGRPTGRNEP